MVDLADAPTIGEPRWPRNPVRDYLAELAPLLDEISSLAPVWERERSLPFEHVDRLRESGLTVLRIPAELGGGGMSVRDLYAVLIEVAAADSNIAHALRNHFATVEGMLAGNRQALERWLPRLLAGDTFGSATTDAGTNNVEGARTVLSHTVDGLRLNGVKHYCTGTLYAQWIPVLAVTEDGRPVTVTIPTDRPGVVMHDDWAGMGQRLTATGTTELVDVAVYEDEVVLRESSVVGQYTIGLRQLHLAAVIAGIGQRIVQDAVRFVRTRARPAVHGRFASSSEDLFVQRTIGTLAASARSARLAVLGAADSLDELFEVIGRGDLEAAESLRDAVSLEIAQTQISVWRLVSAASSDLFEVAGASMTGLSHALDRHWRNARTIASHNPLDYKAQAIGDHLLNGTSPPTSGFF